MIWRVAGGCAYQLAVAIDDAARDIYVIVRGSDSLKSTPRQILLQRLLRFAQPTYAHLPLALGADGRKLSKHEAALPGDVAASLPALRTALGFLGQVAPNAGNPATLLARAVRKFDPRRFPRATLHLPFAAVREEIC